VLQRTGLRPAAENGTVFPQQPQTGLRPAAGHGMVFPQQLQKAVAG